MTVPIFYIIPLLNILVSGKTSSSCIITFWFPGPIRRWWGKDGTFICTRLLDNIRKRDHHKSITYVVMFDGASNIQLGVELLKINYPKI